MDWREETLVYREELSRIVATKCLYYMGKYPSMMVFRPFAKMGFYKHNSPSSTEATFSAGFSNSSQSFSTDSLPSMTVFS